MSTTQVPLMQATVTKDEATSLTVIEQSLAALAGLITNGKLAVNASGVTLTADLIDLDVEAITGAGAAAKSLADVVTALGTPAQDAAVASGAVGAVSVGATTTVVLAAGAKRERVVLTNDSDETIYIAVGASAEMSKGIPLGTGSSVVLTPSGGSRLAINAICASGGKALAYQTLSTA